MSSSFYLRILHAVVEGTAFAVTTYTGVLSLLVLHIIAHFLLGNERALLLFSCILLLSLTRSFLIFLSSYHPPEAAESVQEWWDWKPSSDSTASTAAWEFSRELCYTSSKVATFKKLIEVPTLSGPDIAFGIWSCWAHRVQMKGTGACGKPTSQEASASVSLDSLKKLRHYMGFAYAAYENSSSNILAMLERQRVGEDYSLLMTHYPKSYEDYHPAYFVAVNRKREQVIISIRGTASFVDAIRDAVVVPMNFGGNAYAAHRGIAKAAMEIDDLVSVLCGVLHDCGFRITVVGHSLGAGTAALLAYRLREKGLERVTAYSFACPPCVNSELGLHCESFVTSVLNKNDVIPRMSPRCLLLLTREIVALPWDEIIASLDQNFIRKRAAVRVASGIRAAFDEKTIEIARNGSAEAWLKRYEDVSHKHFLDFRIPGNVVSLSEHFDSSSAKPTSECDNNIRALKVDANCSSIVQIALTSSILEDHRCEAYLSSLDLLIKTGNSEES